MENQKNAKELIGKALELETKADEKSLEQAHILKKEAINLGGLAEEDEILCHYITFENLLNRDLAKYRKRTRMFLMIAGFSTIFVLTFLIYLKLLHPKYDSLSPVFNSLMIIMGIADLGVFAWPFWLYQLVRRNNIRKWVAELPPPGKARLEYAINWCENRHWVRLPSEEKDEGKITMQQQKRFNIFLGLFFVLFGLIGYFIYLKELKKPGPRIELSLTEEGFVKIV